MIPKVNAKLAEFQPGCSLKNISCMSHLKILSCRQDDLTFVIGGR